jgi:ABC-2 type transport system ATP-binding protein
LKSELRGDTVQIELASWDAAASAAAALIRVPGVRDAAPEGSVVRARADSAARAVPAVLSALEDSGLEVSSITVSRPSLDDVYLRHAGRSFEEAA